MGTCVGCGAPLAPTWKYCIHCGIAVDAAEIPAAIRPAEATGPRPAKAVNRLLLAGGIGTFLIGLALIVVAVAYAIGGAEVTVSSAGWREPTSTLALRWGTYRGRYLAGLLLIMGGLVLLAGSNTYTVTFLLVGTATHIAGWYILPAGGARRLWVAWPSLLCVWLLLTGPQILFTMVLPLFGWLVVRQRPFRSYVVLVIPVAVGIALANTFHTNRDMPVAFAIESVAVVGSAWLARALAATRRTLDPVATRG